MFLARRKAKFQVSLIILRRFSCRLEVSAQCNLGHWKLQPYRLPRTLQTSRTTYNLGSRQPKITITLGRTNLVNGVNLHKWKKFIVFNSDQTKAKGVRLKLLPSFGRFVSSLSWRADSFQMVCIRKVQLSRETVWPWGADSFDGNSNTEGTNQPTGIWESFHAGDT